MNCHQWVLPGILADRVNKRRHWYFGAHYRSKARELFAFWQAARAGTASAVACCYGNKADDSVAAPVAVYATKVRVDRPGYLLMQHGSYQLVEASDQPSIPSGEVFVYRGVGNANTFQWPQLGPLAGRRQQAIWRRYVAVQTHVLSDSVRSFNSIHDRAARGVSDRI